MKRHTVKRILSRVPGGIPVKLVTRWRAYEVRCGVSDLEVLDLVKDRPNTSLEILDALHAKAYLCDGTALIGSANLTATALGWAKDNNVELLFNVPASAPEIVDLMAALENAVLATSDMRDTVQAAADAIDLNDPPDPQLDQAAGLGPWLPISSAPERLWTAYGEEAEQRLTSSYLNMARADLSALSIPSGLNENEFNAAVASALCTMPAMTPMLDGIDRGELSDAEAIQHIKGLKIEGPLDAAMQWEVVRNWLRVFLPDTIEVVAATFITRKQPGVRTGR
ncbi:hypothetical protein KCG46_07220 [Erythrobacter sp. WH158]|uniref:PLD phosphodiesterase domain-containing protein n=2 Tax=Erythrobacter crassostreae TaxID=2828328 RepID=A0A9X1JKV5_9SPHN|nr:hypothetical protein [Erythrobacter crassostrea]